MCIFACYCVYGVVWARISCIRSISQRERTTQINLIAVICINSKNTPVQSKKQQIITNKQINAKWKKFGVIHFMGINVQRFLVAVIIDDSLNKYCT